MEARPDGLFYYSCQCSRAVERREDLRLPPRKPMDQSHCFRSTGSSPPPSPTHACGPLYVRMYTRIQVHSSRMGFSGPHSSFARLPSVVAESIAMQAHLKQCAVAAFLRPVCTWLSSHMDKDWPDPVDMGSGLARQKQGWKAACRRQTTTTAACLGQCWVRGTSSAWIVSISCCTLHLTRATFVSGLLETVLLSKAGDHAATQCPHTAATGRDDADDQQGRATTSTPE